jgi:hypothetical protein
MAAEQGPQDSGIPRILHSIQTGAPFLSCIDCGAALSLTGQPYGVEKVLRNGEVVFEYAICTNCTFALMREFSKESLARMADYVEKMRRELCEPDAEDLDRFLRALEGDDTFAGVDPELRESPDHCHRCGRTGSEFEDEHTVVGMLTGSKLVTGISTICAKCTDGMEDVLSKHTRESHDDFVRRNFPGVPAGIDIPVGVLSI